MKEKKKIDYEQFDYFTGWGSLTGVLSNLIFISLIVFSLSIFFPFCRANGEPVYYWELPISASLGYCFAGLPAALTSFLKIRFLKNDTWREGYVGLLAAAAFCLCGAACAIGLLEFAKYEYAKTATRLTDGLGAVVCKVGIGCIAIFNVAYAILWALLAKGRIAKARLSFKK